MNAVEVEAAGGTEAPMDVTQAPAWLRASYSRFALISHRRHLAALDPTDSETLVVVTDWLLWQRCLREGRHVLHYEFLLAEMPTERGPVKDMVLRAGNWIWDGDTDITQFMGVSLGQVFIRQCAMAVQALERLWHGLDRLCRRFGPREVVLLDLRGDLDMVEDEQKRMLVEALARRHGLNLVDRFDPVAAGDADFPNPLVFHTSSEARWRQWCRAVYARAVGAAFGLRWYLRGRPAKIFLLLDVHQIHGMMAAFTHPTLAPVIDAGTAPKSWRFLREAWGKGLVLTCPPSGALGAADVERLCAIETALEQRWASHFPADIIEAALRVFVRKRLLSGGAFAATARVVKRYGGLLGRHAVQRVVVGDADFAQGRVVAELAAHRAIPVDESFNGIFLTDWRTPSRCGDGHKPPTLTRLLAWGGYCRSWLTAIGSPIDMVVTGNPSLDAVTPVPHHGSPRRRALVLPPYTIEIDPPSLSGMVGPYLVELMRVLRARGFDDIHIKVHPGHANPAYYRSLLAEFGENIPVHGAGSVRSQAEWADIVIGPPTTGAMAECLAIGRPYYAHIAEPSGIDLNHIPFVRVFRTAAEIGQALAEGWAPDCSQVLAELCAKDPQTPASRRVWDCLAASVGPRSL